MATPLIIAAIVGAIILLFTLIIAFTVSIALRIQHHKENKVMLTRTLNISKQEMQQTIFANTTDNLNKNALTGYTSLGDARRLPYTINDIEIDKNKAPNVTTNFKQILLPETKTGTETISDDMMNLMYKHKNILTTSYKIDDEVCCELLSDRIAMAAYFEDTFKKHSEIIPNTTIIHELITNCNQAGLLSAQFYILTNICNKKNSTSPSTHILPNGHITTSLTPISEDKITSNITTNVTLWETNTNQTYDIKYKLGFTISSKDPQPFTNTSYEDIKMELIVPIDMQDHITTLNPIKRTRYNKDNTILIDKKTTSDNQISLTYSIPNLEVPSIINQSNLNCLLGHIDECKIEHSITQKKQR